MGSPTSIRLTRAIACLLLAGAVSACSIFTKKDTEYKNARSAPPLKIPSDLSRPPPNPETEIPTLSGGVGKGAPASDLEVPPQVALESNDVTAVRDGALSWLLVQSSQDELWQRIKDFWAKNGIDLAYENRKYYVAETDWVARGAAGAGASGGKVKYRLRLVQFPDEDGTEVYLNAYTRGATPDAVKGAGADLATPMLKRLATYLGGPGVNTAKLLTQAAPRQVGELIDDKDRGLFLKLDLTPAMAWRHVDEALARLGYVVIGQTRGKKYEFEGETARPQETEKAGKSGAQLGKGKRGPARGQDKGAADDKGYDLHGHNYLVSTTLPKKKAAKKKGWFSWLFFSHAESAPVSADFHLSLAPANKSASRLTVGDDPSTGAKTEKDRKILKDIYKSLD